MPAPLSVPQSCCAPSCTDTPAINIPGPKGDPGTSGIDGVDGLSPVTSVTAQFLMPAEGANVTVAVLDSSGIVIGSKMFVQTAGTMGVISKPGNTSVVLQNLENTASSLYTDNAAPTTAIPAGSLMMPTGAQGASGALSGAAGGHLKGNYPNPTLSRPNTKGRILVGDGTDAIELAAGTNGNVIRYNSATASGLETGAVNLAGGANHVTGALPIANGGTSGTTQQAAINALAGLTSRGDTLVRNSAGDVVRVPLGAAFRVWQSNGTDPSWGLLTPFHFDSAYKIGSRHTAILARQSIDLNAAAGSDTAVLLAYTLGLVIPRRIILHDASVNLTGSAARLGIYTSTAKGGQILVTDPNSQLTGLTASTKYVELTLNATMTTDIVTVPGPPSVLYVHLSVPHGSAATVRMTIFADDLSS